ncbi:hypothetical protein HYR99_02205 [Candidatus Poribacteria bacterium]|nr:hypothetical protein [Candidatus Poribacteria bacterium]
MRYQSICYWVFALFVVGFVACGDSGVDEAQLTKPATQPQSQTPVDFGAEEAAIQDMFTLHAAAIGTKDLDKIMSYWLKSDTEEVFTAWTFGGAFEKSVTSKGVRDGWASVFRLLGGNMTVDITSVAIDAKAEKATLHATYRWAVSGELIAALKKEKGVWKIRAIDYTNERFGKQIEEIQKPA